MPSAESKTVWLATLNFAIDGFNPKLPNTRWQFSVAGRTYRKPRIFSHEEPVKSTPPLGAAWRILRGRFAVPLYGCDEFAPFLSSPLTKNQPEEIREKDYCISGFGDRCDSPVSGLCACSRCDSCRPHDEQGVIFFVCQRYAEGQHGAWGTWTGTQSNFELFRLEKRCRTARGRFNKLDTRRDECASEVTPWKLSWPNYPTIYVLSLVWAKPNKNRWNVTCLRVKHCAGRWWSNRRRIGRRLGRRKRPLKIVQTFNQGGKVVLFVRCIIPILSAWNPEFGDLNDQLLDQLH